MFQLIYLRFTQPRADATIFGVMTTQIQGRAGQSASRRRSLRSPRRSTAALSQNHLRARPFTLELVDEMSLAKSLGFYKDRFADASDFTFMFVGSFDLATIKPLVERYLGALPSTGRKRDVEGRRAAPAPRRGREAGLQGDRAEEPGRARLHRAVPVRPDQPDRDSRHEPGAREPAARRAPRGPRRHLQRRASGRATRSTRSRNSRSRSTSARAQIGWTR